MDVIFLDIDGVLTSERTALAGPSTTAWRQFDPVAVNFFNVLAERNLDLHFVISSQWRLIFNKEALCNMLRVGGFAGHLASPHERTPELKGSTRGAEINAWLNTYSTLFSVKKYLIIDQAHERFLPDQRKNLILTDDNNGLSYQNMLDIFDRIVRGR